MRKNIVAAVVTAFLVSAPALAGEASPDGLAAPSSGSAQVELAMTQQTLPANGTLAEHSQPYLRYLYVLSGELKVSNLVTGDEQRVQAGGMAVETPNDWHVAKAMGAEPVVFVTIDQAPEEPKAAAHNG